MRLVVRWPGLGESQRSRNFPKRFIPTTPSTDSTGAMIPGMAQFGPCWMRASGPKLKQAGALAFVPLKRNAQTSRVRFYNVNAKNWIAPSEAVDDIEQEKERAAAYAEAYLRRMGCVRCLHWFGRRPGRFKKRSAPQQVQQSTLSSLFLRLLNISNCQGSARRTILKVLESSVYDWQTE